MARMGDYLGRGMLGWRTLEVSILMHGHGRMDDSLGRGTLEREELCG